MSLRFGACPRREGGSLGWYTRCALPPLPFVSDPRILRAITLAALVAGLGLVYQATGRVVTLVVDGRSFVVRTHASTVGGVLREVGRALRPPDRVSHDLRAAVGEGATIVWERAHSILVEGGPGESVVVSGESRPLDVLQAAGQPTFPGDRIWADGVPILGGADLTLLRPERIRIEPRRALEVDLGGLKDSVRSAAPSLGEALWDAGIRVREGDRPSRRLDAPLSGTSLVEVGLARPITIETDGEERRAWVASATIGEALEDAGLALTGLDYSLPPPESPIPGEGRIRVVRVIEQVETVLEPLDFESTFEGDPEIEIDQQRLISPGTLGVAATTTRVRYEDGVEVTRIEEGRRIAREPEPRVIGYGTRIETRRLDTPDGSIEYWRAVSMYATAYSPCNSAADRCYPNTSSGKPVQRGVVAVLLRWYRVMKGQPVYIPGYGVATIEDVGGGIPGRYWIDLGYSDSDIVSWNRWVTVYFLTPVPSPDRIYWVLD